MNRWMLSFAIGIGVFGMATHAHHSIAAVYDSSQQVTIEGVVTRLQFVNPHPFVTIDVQDGSGTAQQWRLEMDTHRELVEIGFTSETLRPGDRIVVMGSLAHRQAHNLYIRRLDRPSDGFWYEVVGRSPRIRQRSD